MSGHAPEAQAPEGADGWVDRAERTLSGRGFRRGGARRALLECLGSEHCARTAPELEAELQASGRRVSRASIYRILEQLELLGLVKRISTGESMTRYERVREQATHHHHLICERCGAVSPFSDRDIEQAIAALSERVPLAVSEHEIVLRGRCRGCQGRPGRER